MSITHETETELNAMLDEGVRVEVAEQGDDVYRVRVVVEDAACADCLVPDATLASIAADALQRRGARVSSVRVEHEEVGGGTDVQAVGGMTGTMLPEAEQTLGATAPVPPVPPVAPGSV